MMFRTVFMRTATTGQGANVRCFSMGVTTNWRGRARFYGDVDVVESKTDAGKFEIELDKRKLRTPAQRMFQLPTRGLAGLVAQEWDAQVSQLETSVMPVTMQCAMAIDVNAFRRGALISELLRYMNTDIVCFPQRLLQPGDIEEFSGEREKFRTMQLSRWQKAMDHFAKTYGKLEILDSDTLRSPNHDPAAYARVTARLEALNDFQLTAVHNLAQGCKSLVVPFALLDRKITVREALDAARVEDDHQITNWGLVEGAHDVDHENLLAQLAAASLIIWLS